MGAKLSYVNLVDDAATVLAASGSAAPLPVANLLDQRLQKVWRSNSITPYLTIDFGSAKAFNVVGLFGLALASTDTIRIRASNTAYTTGDLLDTTATACGNVAGYDQYIFLTSATVTARYVRIDFNAASLSGPGYLDLGRLFIGPLVYPAINFGAGASANTRDESVVIRSPRSGVTFGDAGAKVRTWDGTFAWLTEAEKAVFEAMDNAIGTTQQLLFVPSITGDLARDPILGKQKVINAFEQPTLTVPFMYSRRMSVEQDL